MVCPPFEKIFEMFLFVFYKRFENEKRYSVLVEKKN